MFAVILNFYLPSSVVYFSSHHIDLKLCVFPSLQTQLKMNRVESKAFCVSLISLKLNKTCFLHGGCPPRQVGGVDHCLFVWHVMVAWPDSWNPGLHV